jgi:succinoglycan biosynthesis protein ExoM
MSIPNVSVCICTFKRAALLRGLLDQLEAQRTDDLFSFDVVIADNDLARSAESTVQAFAARTSLRVTYCVEPEPNIARARNAAVANSTGELIAFIDDDELPTNEWLYWLFQAWIRYRAAGVLGPVMARFQQEPPDWVSKGRFFDTKQDARSIGRKRARAMSC